MSKYLKAVREQTMKVSGERVFHSETASAKALGQKLGWIE